MRLYGKFFAESPAPPSPSGGVLSSRGTSVLPVAAGRRRVGERGLRWTGALVAAVGVLMLCLAAGDALAGVEIGGRGDNVLRGSAGADRLAGFDGGDTLHGAAGDDTLYGGAGDDEIYGGPGEDNVLGGAGDDFIEAKDGTTDRVGCGPGTDSVSVDREDMVYADCEAVYPG